MSAGTPRQTPADRERVHPLMRIPVPWVFVLAYLAGAGLQRIRPTMLNGRALLVSQLAGVLFMAAGAALAVWCLWLFRRAGTTTVPGERSAALVVQGPYRWSRNPMYVSLTAMYLGEAGILAQGWPLLTLLPTLLYLHHIVIPVEEARLRQAFSEAYVRYCARVGRWIPHR